MNLSRSRHRPPQEMDEHACQICGASLVEPSHVACRACQARWPADAQHAQALACALANKVPRGTYTLARHRHAASGDPWLTDDGCMTRPTEDLR